MVMNSIEKASQLRSKLPKILRTLKSRLGSNIGDSWRVSSMKKTRFSLQFNMSRCSTPGDPVKVDLLPTFEAVEAVEASVEDINGKYLTARVAMFRSPLVVLLIVSFLLILAIMFRFIICFIILLFRTRKVLQKNA